MGIFDCIPTRLRRLGSKHGGFKASQADGENEYESPGVASLAEMADRLVDELPELDLPTCTWSQHIQSTLEVVRSGLGAEHCHLAILPRGNEVPCIIRCPSEVCKRTASSAEGIMSHPLPIMMEESSSIWSRLQQGPASSAFLLTPDCSVLPLPQAQAPQMAPEATTAAAAAPTPTQERSSKGTPTLCRGTSKGQAKGLKGTTPTTAAGSSAPAAAATTAAAVALRRGDLLLLPFSTRGRMAGVLLLGWGPAGSSRHCTAVAAAAEGQRQAGCTDDVRILSVADVRSLTRMARFVMYGLFGQPEQGAFLVQVAESLSLLPQSSSVRQLLAATMLAVRQLLRARTSLDLCPVMAATYGSSHPAALFALRGNATSPAASAAAAVGTCMGGYNADGSGHGSCGSGSASCCADGLYSSSAPARLGCDLARAGLHCCTPHQQQPQQGCASLGKQSSADCSWQFDPSHHPPLQPPPGARLLELPPVRATRTPLSQTLLLELLLQPQPLQLPLPPLQKAATATPSSAPCEAFLRQDSEAMMASAASGGGGAALKSAPSRQHSQQPHEQYRPGPARCCGAPQGQPGGACGYGGPANRLSGDSSGSSRHARLHRHPLLSTHIVPDAAALVMDAAAPCADVLLGGQLGGLQRVGSLVLCAERQGQAPAAALLPQPYTGGFYDREEQEALGADEVDCELLIQDRGPTPSLAAGAAGCPLAAPAPSPPRPQLAVYAMSSEVLPAGMTQVIAAELEALMQLVLPHCHLALQGRLADEWNMLCAPLLPPPPPPPLSPSLPSPPATPPRPAPGATAPSAAACGASSGTCDSLIAAAAAATVSGGGDMRMSRADGACTASNQPDLLQSWERSNLQRPPPPSQPAPPMRLLSRFAAATATRMAFGLHCPEGEAAIPSASAAAVQQGQGPPPQQQQQGSGGGCGSVDEADVGDLDLSSLDSDSACSTAELHEGGPPGGEGSSHGAGRAGGPGSGSTAAGAGSGVAAGGAAGVAAEAAAAPASPFVLRGFSDNTTLTSGSGPRLPVCHTGEAVGPLPPCRPKRARSYPVPCAIPTVVFEPMSQQSPLALLVDTLAASLAASAAGGAATGSRGAACGGGGPDPRPQPPASMPSASGSPHHPAMQTPSTSTAPHPHPAPHRSSDLRALQLHEALGRGGQGVVLRGCWGGLRAAVKCIVQPPLHAPPAAPVSPAAPPAPVAPVAAAGSGAGASAGSVACGGCGGAGSGGAGGGAGAGVDADAAPKAGRRRLLRCAWELAVTPALSHPNIVQVYAVFTDVAIVRVTEGRAGAAGFAPASAAASPSAPAAPYLRLVYPADSMMRGVSQNVPLYSALCLEYCDAGTLLSVSREGAFRQRPPQPPAAAACAASCPLVSLYTSLLEVALALRLLHSRRLVHGDLKPANVLLQGSSRDPRGWTCKLSDFGCARLLSGSEVAAGGSRQAHPSGTLPYMAPELLSAEGRQGFHSDVFAFGIMMWELLYGAAPYHRVDAAVLPSLVVRQQLRPTFDATAPSEFAALASQCWSRLPGARPSTGELVERLQVLLTRARADAAAANHSCCANSAVTAAKISSAVASPPPTPQQRQRGPQQTSPPPQQPRAQPTLPQPLSAQRACWQQQQQQQQPPSVATPPRLAVAQPAAQARGHCYE